MESASTSSSTSIITPEDVLESLMNDGTIDALRLKIINQLKANVRFSPFSLFFCGCCFEFSSGFCLFLWKVVCFFGFDWKIVNLAGTRLCFQVFKGLVSEVYFFLLFVSMESYFFNWKIVNLMRIHLCFQIV